MLLPKDLIYEDRSFDYLVNDDNNCGLYEDLSDLLIKGGCFASDCSLEEIEKYIAVMLNTARYICVEAFAMRRPVHRFHEYCDYCDYIHGEIQSIANSFSFRSSNSFGEAILSIVYFLLYSLWEPSFGIKELMGAIDKKFPILRFKKDFWEITQGEPVFEPNDFKPLPFKHNLFKPYSWELLTKGFDPSYTTLLVNALGNSIDEKLAIVKYIRLEVEKKGDIKLQTSMGKKLNEIEAKLKAGKPLVYERAPREYLAEGAKKEGSSSSTENEHLNEEQKAQLQKVQTENQRLQEEVAALHAQLKEKDRMLEKQENIVKPTEDQEDEEENHGKCRLTRRQVVLLFQELGIDFSSNEYIDLQTADLLNQLTGISSQNFRDLLGELRNKEESDRTRKDRIKVKKMIEKIKA